MQHSCSLEKPLREKKQLEGGLYLCLEEGMFYVWMESLRDFRVIDMNPHLASSGLVGVGVASGFLTKC